MSTLFGVKSNKSPKPRIVLFFVGLEPLNVWLLLFLNELLYGSTSCNLMKFNFFQTLNNLRVLNLRQNRVQSVEGNYLIAFKSA